MAQKSEHSSADICLEPAAAPNHHISLDARLQQILEESWAEFENEYLHTLRPAPAVHQRGQKPAHAHQKQAQ